MMTALSLVAAAVIAAPPDPPTGKRWVLNEAFSDEFDGTELDRDKWYDYHPKWRGRPPGLFVPENVSVGDGMLKLKGGLLDREVKIGEHVYTISCAAVTSKSDEASFGYYECRFKASKTTLSTTFWLSTRKTADGPEEGNDRYGLELDIQECIGRPGDFQGSYFATGMNANSHFWYTDSKGERYNLVAKPSVRFHSERLASEDFNVYGCWWRDESSATFYFNDSEGRDMQFYTGIKEKPFDLPMAMNLVSETYPSPWIALPTQEELLDPARNTSYYDWVRSYVLVDVDEVSPPPPYEVFPLFLRIDEQASSRSGWKTLSFVYSCNRRQTAVVEVRDGNEQVVFRSHHVLQPGLGKKEIPLPLPGGPPLSERYRVRIAYQDSEPPVEAMAMMVEPRPEPPPPKLVVVWSEDFEGAPLGATSGNNQTLEGTVVQTANTLSGEVVTAPAEFTSASGHVIRLSTGANPWASMRPPEAIDLTSQGLGDTLRYRLSFDYYLPQSLARWVGSVQLKWTGADGTSETVVHNTCERRRAGVWRAEYTGTFPVDTGPGSFIPVSVLPIIRFDQDGVAADGLAYVDNIRFAVGPSRTR